MLQSVHSAVSRIRKRSLVSFRSTGLAAMRGKDLDCIPEGLALKFCIVWEPLGFRV